MPIYEYRCPKCRHLFEEWTKSINDTEEEPCPRCGASAPRVISQTSFVLKGGGWYVSDYGYRKGIKEDGEGAAAAAPDAAGSASGGQGSAGAEAPAAASGGATSEVPKADKESPASDGKAAADRNASPASPDAKVPPAKTGKAGGKDKSAKTARAS